MKKNRLFCILAPTASGKKEITQVIADKINSEQRAPSTRICGDAPTYVGAEIVSLDSMKIYRGMDIGTAKPTQLEIKKYHYHLVDIVSPQDSYDTARFLMDCQGAIKDIRKKDKQPILVVGTPLYLQCLLYGIFEGPPADKAIRLKLEEEANNKGLTFLYECLKKVDPKRVKSVHENDRKRIVRALEVYEITGKPMSSFQTHWAPGQDKKEQYPAILVGLRWEKQTLLKRIDQRVDKMFKDGLIEEVKELWTKKMLGEQSIQGIAYQEVVQHLKGEISLEETKELTKKRTHALAKKQMTWFRSFKDVEWIDISEGVDKGEIVDRVIKYFLC
ncbi:MAG: tRNA (adenosine(37)-N6)-dimethylallyltransferase MiaA [Planctomycetes bacterium]|nr:tRNA (adenosine(37)-N6)-dimethylallyltransferase MiaA [Planctomycetota bacterium]